MYPLSPTGERARAMEASSRVASPAWTVTKRVRLGCFSPATDGPSAVGLSCEGLVVPGRAALGVGPHRPPRTRAGARVPHRLGLEAFVPLAPGASLGGDGVDEPPVGEGVALPVEVGLQVAGGADLTGVDDEPRSGFVQGLEVGR